MQINVYNLLKTKHSCETGQIFSINLMDYRKLYMETWPLIAVMNFLWMLMMVLLLWWGAEESHFSTCQVTNELVQCSEAYAQTHPEDLHTWWILWSVLTTCRIITLSSLLIFGMFGIGLILPVDTKQQIACYLCKPHKVLMPALNLNNVLWHQQNNQGSLPTIT